MKERSVTSGLFAHGKAAFGKDFEKPLVFPCFLNIAFVMRDISETKQRNNEFSYVRFNNPDREALADKVSFLENGEHSHISSGMGAIFTLHL